MGQKSHEPLVNVLVVAPALICHERQQRARLKLDQGCPTYGTRLTTQVVQQWYDKQFLVVHHHLVAWERVQLYCTRDIVWTEV